MARVMAGFVLGVAGVVLLTMWAEQKSRVRW